MTALTIVRKFGKLIRGGADKPQITLACVLGLLLGMSVGFNALSVVVLLLLILLNANGLVAVIAVVLGKILSLALAPVTFRIGYVVIHNLGLQGLFGLFSVTPVVALMDLHYYCQTGGILVALILGIPSGLFLGSAVRRLRRKLADASRREGSYAKLASNRVTKIFMWILFGRQKKTMLDMIDKRPPIIRRGGVILVAVLAGLMVAAELLLSGALIKSDLEASLSRAVGAEVDIDKVRFSLLGGSLSIEGLQVTDPEKPGQNVFQAADLTVDLSVMDLLARRLSIDDLTISKVKLGAKRAKKGWLAPRDEKAKEEWKIKLPADLLTDYFARAKEYRAYLPHLKKLDEWLKQRKAGPGKPAPSAPTVDELIAESRQNGYMSLSARSVIASRPLVTIRKLKIDSIRLAGGGDVFHIDGKEISSRPDLNGKDMVLDIRSDGGVVGELVLRYAKPRQPNTLKLDVPNIPLKPGILGGKSPVAVESGSASVSVDGTFTADGLDLPVLVQVTDLHARARTGRSVVGVAPSQAQRMIENIREMKLAVTIKGPLSAPRLVMDDRQVLAAMRDSLSSAGKAMLANQASRQLKKLGAGSRLHGVLGAIGSLLGPEKNAGKNGNRKKTKEGKKKPGLLDLLK